MLAVGNALRLFVLFRTPVYVTGPYFLLLLFFTWPDLVSGRMELAFLFAFAVTASLLVHEFGHVFAAKWNGHNARVVLVGLGAITIPDGQDRGFRGMVLSLAGPAAGLALALVLYFFFSPEGTPEFQRYVLGRRIAEDGTLWPFLHHSLVQIGVIWTIFNLMPILPMDGGHALRDFLGMFLRARKAEFIASVVGLVVAVSLAWFFLSNNLLLAGLLVAFMAWQNWESMNRNR